MTKLALLQPEFFQCFSATAFLASRICMTMLVVVEGCVEATEGNKPRKQSAAWGRSGWVQHLKWSLNYHPYFVVNRWINECFHLPVGTHFLPMVSPLTDHQRAKKLSKLMHDWLSTDLALPLPKWDSGKGKIYAFGAFMGVPWTKVGKRPQENQEPARNRPGSDQDDVLDTQLTTHTFSILFPSL